MIVKDLHITDSLQKLDIVAQKDDVIRNLKKSHKFTQVANKINAELLQCQDDQEKCYILCVRYIRLMDHLFQITDDKSYCQSLYLGDYKRITQLRDELRKSLDDRYNIKMKPKENNTPTGPAKSPTIPKNNQEIGDVQEFKEKFILPKDLFNLLQKEKNFLLVDIRPQTEFESCRISGMQGTVINIPGDLIVPGLSANTLGQRLDDSLKKIWEKRDDFDLIIFMDSDTQKYNFVGSKLERLRSFIVEWDTLRQYKHEPVVLNGGLREFVEWYPTTVDNSQVFLSQTNSEMDELLDLESIQYPESGSTKQMNLKMHDIDSMKRLEKRIKRDFEETDEDDANKLQSLSEGNLPLDFYASKEPMPLSRYKSLSQEELRKDLVMPEPQDLFPHAFEGGQTPKPEVEAAEIKEILEGDKAALLREARKAAKPKFGPEESQEKGDLRRESPRKINGSIKPTEVKPSPPVIDRSFKPISTIGEGFTGLKNIRNICYMNSILQCLKVIPILKSIYVTTDRYIKYTTRIPPKLNFHFAKVLRELWMGNEGDQRVYYAQEFKKRLSEFAPMYNRNTHEDCFEFFMFLFNALSEDCSLDLPRPKVMTESEKAWYGHLQGRTSIWADNFYHQLKNTKSCCNCGKVNISYENESTLMLAVGTEPDTLKNMVAEYLGDNILSDFSCSHCKSTGAIVNKKELVVEPEVLVVVLKRYAAESDGSFKKNVCDVDFPEFDLQFGSSQYRLYAVVHHSGTMQFGHYFASVLLNDKTGAWALCNDESVGYYSTGIREVTQIKSAAAGFFYTRKRK